MKRSVLFSCFKGMNSLSGIGAIVFVFAGMTSCTSEECISQHFEGTTPVTFNLQAQSIDPITRASAVTMRSPQYLLVLDYIGNELKGTYTRGVSTTTDVDTEQTLSQLTLPLGYGKHTLYILAAYNKWSALDTSSHTISWNASNNLSQTWATKYEVDVNDVSIQAQSVQLPLKVGIVALTIEGKIPETAKTFTFSASKSSWVYDYVNGTGTSGMQNEAAVDISSIAGKINQRLSFYSFEPSDAATVTIGTTDAKNIGTATISLQDENGTHLNATQAPVVINNVGILAGYQTNLNGDFMGYSSSYSFSIQNQWTGQFDISY